MESTWTITELAERAAAALAADGSPQVNGRVRDLPNERLIRWYTTIGLVDPPLGRRGRTALYGGRHLLQLVAIKRRQATGRTIAEIQAELTGATDTTLRQIAQLTTPIGATPPQAVNDPAGAREATDDPAAPGAVVAPGVPGDGPVRERFWAARPTSRPLEAAPPPSADTDAGAEVDARADAQTNAQADAQADAQTDAQTEARADVGAGGRVGVGADASVVQGVRLVPGLTLLLDVPSLGPDDLAAIQNAARPLLDELRRRGLVSDPSSLSAEPPGRSS
ncbi:MerR family transcriptional regulator [Spirillospora sp. NPDC047279]|uniref:MerR family transcriptional regulator n=1 Tax=Spirillospora sp. NPDC047279 TaxID=3155478 RepID=UPI0033C9869F